MYEGDLKTSRYTWLWRSSKVNKLWKFKKLDKIEVRAAMKYFVLKGFTPTDKAW